MTLSYDSPKLTTPEIARLQPKVLKYSFAKESHPQIRLPGTDCLVKAQVSLASFTSFRVGGPAEWYVAPTTLAELQASFAWAQTQALPVLLLGAGSNLLISDRGVPGLVISTRRLRHLTVDPDTGLMTVGAGEPLPKVAWQAAEQGCKGFEWAVGIPGTIGGAVVMNAGAHGGCAADSLVTAEAVSPQGEVKTLTNQDLHYRYRSSMLQGQDWLVTQATFQLQPGFNSIAVTTTTTEQLNQRRTSQPYHLPSCGSVFRNPNDYKAGWLIEQSGLKGYQIGGAQVAQRHANFILNCGNATATDIFRLIHYVQQQVNQRWSLQLEPEVKILGDFSAA